MAPPTFEKDLKSIISTTLRRQHLLGGFHGTKHGILLGSLAVGDYLAHKSGRNVVEELLCGSDSSTASQIQLQGPIEGSQAQLGYQQLYSASRGTIVGSCMICSRLDGGYGVLGFGRSGQALDVYRIAPQLYQARLRSWVSRSTD